ncbi:hypothetical protein KKF91_09310 [Myxococcota bacterium]|nr:hypothetical protein [Myxococcota bacterium]MBU1430739.1 hypothetical protein [Myxococcota bacterium]MBU1900200.1 hypothetical protein [Myxococcota bacterium]
MINTLWRIALGAALLFGGQALAADALTLNVTIIHAQKKAGPTDAALNGAALKRAFKGYNSFKLLDQKALKLSKKGASSLKLPNGQDAHFRYEGLAGARHKINFAVPKKRVDVDLRAPLKRTFYQAGMRYKKGMLILALTLNP